MAELVINFRNIALFVNRPNGVSVIFPMGGPGNSHHLNVSDQDGPREEFAGLNVVLLKNGTRLDEPTGRASDDPVVNVDSITLPNVVRENADNDNRALRWEIGGGHLVAQAAEVLPAYHDLVGPVWYVGDGPPQNLTNALQFRLTLEPGARYTLAAEGGSAILDIDPSGLELRVSNSDDDTGGELDDFAQTNQLTEFGLIGELLMEPTTGGPVLLPNPWIPRALFDSVQSKMSIQCEAPFCPTAQCSGPARA
jgi:hypothetical protein